MEKLIKIDLTVNTEMTSVAVIMTSEHSLTAEDVYEALKQYLDEFKEETVQ